MQYGSYLCFWSGFRIQTLASNQTHFWSDTLSSLQSLHFACHLLLQKASCDLPTNHTTVPGKSRKTQSRHTNVRIQAAVACWIYLALPVYRARVWDPSWCKSCLSPSGHYNTYIPLSPLSKQHVVVNLLCEAGCFTTAKDVLDQWLCSSLVDLWHTSCNEKMQYNMYDRIYIIVCAIRVEHIVKIEGVLLNVFRQIHLDPKSCLFLFNYAYPHTHTTNKHTLVHWHVQCEHLAQV